MAQKSKDIRRLVRLTGQLENLNKAHSAHLAGRISAVEADLQALDALAQGPSLAMDLFPDMFVRKQTELKTEKSRLVAERDRVERDRKRRERQKEKLGERLAEAEHEAESSSQEENGNDWAARSGRSGTSFRQA
ncbi:hypothetical protein CSC94_17860 [Zhengella mangrovi]|uniref:Flagellar export protein FliJ n=1 Tax=Zhengella mangrovi TaxID=1982044 RepID=A0A2G1QJS9_9HYPH|nr:hypothetical protein [Zhengella mangrovi]PHP65714.1 hypothetical protein CSC94_17860 [Zhengella mangrovi]